MTMNWLMLGSLYPVYIIVYFVEKKMCRHSGKYYFGVLLEPEWLEKAEFKEIDARFKKEMRYFFLGTFWIPALSFLSEHVSVEFTVWIIWFVLAIFGFEYPYVHAFYKLKAYKKIWSLEKKALEKESQAQAEDESVAEGYTKEMFEEDGGKETYYVDLSAVEQVRSLRWYHVIPQLVIAVVVIIAVYTIPNGGQVGDNLRNVYKGVTVTFGLMSLMFAGIAYGINRSRMEVICDDAEVNKNYNRAKKTLWRNFWSFALWINTVFMVALSIGVITGRFLNEITLVGSILEAFAMMIYIYFLAKKFVRINEKYRKDLKEDYIQDTEDHWILGMLYYNPKDKRNWIEHRAGVGMSLNMAKPAGKIMMAIGLIAFLAIPVVSVWLLVEEFAPRTITIENQTIVCQNNSVDYEIALNEITEITMEALPEERMKINGTNYNDFEKGTFEKYRMGKFYIFAYTDLDQVICVKTGEDMYFLGLETEEETQVLYESILTRIFIKY